MPLALTGAEWGVLLVSVVPAVLAVVVVYFVLALGEAERGGGGGRAARRRDDVTRAADLAATRKERPSFELASELVFRPLAHLRRAACCRRCACPPPAVVARGTAVGFWAAGELLDAATSCWPRCSCR